MANRQRTSVTTAGQVSRRLPGQLLRTLQRRLKVWRSEKADALLFGPLDKEQGAADAGDRKATLRRRGAREEAGSKIDEATLDLGEHRYVRQYALAASLSRRIEGRIGAQPTEIVGVFIAAGDGEDAGARDVGHGVRHARWIARILDRSGKPVSQVQRPLGRGQKHHAVRGDASAVKRSCDPLASHGWN